MKGRLSFILALWVAIGVAMLSALAPLGPPSSRSTGSAFNPATTSVILKSRAPAPQLSQPPVGPDGGGLTPPVPAVLLVLPLTFILAIGRMLRPAPAEAVRQLSLKPFSFLTRRRARAPPSLS